MDWMGVISAGCVALTVHVLADSKLFLMPA